MIGEAPVFFEKAFLSYSEGVCVYVVFIFLITEYIYI